MDYQQHTLNLLKEIFGFNHLTFNLVNINQNIKLYNPKLLNIPKDAIERYYGYHYKTDIFYEALNTNIWYNKKVITVKDLMSTSQFESSEYYLDFLKKDMLYYELLMPLKINNTLIGALGVFKQKEEDDFTNKELTILEKLNEFITNDLWISLELASIQKECYVYSNYFDGAPAGIIILNRRGSVMRYNRAAETFAYKLQFGNSIHSSLQEFIYEVFSKFPQELNNTQQEIKFSYKSYKINIVPHLIFSICENTEPFYMVFITEVNEEKWEEIGIIQKRYNLTAREGEILELVKNGMTNEEIANNLYISIHTVKSHMENILKKLQVKNRTAALSKFNKNH